MRPTMRFVLVKSEEIRGAAMIFRMRGLLIRQRTHGSAEAGELPFPAGKCRHTRKLQHLGDLTFGRVLLHVTGKEIAMPTPVSERVQRRRDALRAAGLRPVQIWVPDTRRPGFADECRRQAALVAQADRRDAGLDDFMDAALFDMDDWE